MGKKSSVCPIQTFLEKNEKTTLTLCFPPSVTKVRAHIHSAARHSYSSLFYFSPSPYYHLTFYVCEKISSMMTVLFVWFCSLQDPTTLWI